MSQNNSLENKSKKTVIICSHVVHSNKLEKFKL